MGTTGFIRALARGARGKDAAKALIIPDWFGTCAAGGSYPYVELDGSAPLELPNAAPKPMLSLETNIVPVQDLHGYDSPWPAGGGKNKFFHGTELSGQYIQQNGIVASSDGWMVSDYIPVLPDTQYTFNPNSTGGNSAYAAFYNENKSKKGATIPSGKQTFTTYEDTAYMRFSFRATSEDIQLELGSTDTAFAPYSNLCPISGWQGADVYIEPTYDQTATPKASVTFGVQGKNLIDMSEANIVLNKYIDNSGVGKTSDANFYNSVYIPVEPSTKYTLSTSTSVSYVSFMEYDAQKSFIKRTLLSNFDTSGSVTTGITTAYILVGSNPDGTKMTYEKVAAIKWMLNEGNASSYEPYRDYILGGTAEIVAGTGSEEWTELTLNGTETWGGSGVHSMYTQVNTLAQMNDYSQKMLCETLKPYKNQNDQEFINAEYGITGYGFRDYPNQNWIYIAAAGINNTTDLKAWLTQNPVKVVFVKATPTPFTFPPAEVSTSKGDNYVWTDCGNQLSVTYPTTYKIETLSASGTSPLLLEQSQAKKLVQCDIGITATQDGSGDPYPPGGGKNLVDFIVRDQNGLTTVKQGGKAVISGTATGSTSYPVDLIGVELPAGTYVWSIDGLKTGMSAAYKKNDAWAGYLTQGATFTLTETASIGGYISVPVGTATDTTVSIMLESGSTASDWAAYSNIRPIHGVSTLSTTIADNSAGTGGTTYSTEFGCMGKNLYNPATVADGKWLNATTGEVENANGYYVTDFIAIEPNTNYYKTAVGSTRHCYYKADKTFLKSSGWGGGSASESPEGAYYVRFTGKTSTIAYDGQIMFEKGNSASPYEPYTNECYGGTYNELTGELTMSYGIVDLGTLAWMANGTDAIYGTIPNKKAGSVNALCEALVQVSNSLIPLQMPNASFKCYADNANIAIKLTGIDTNNAATMLAGYKFVYELATPITKNYDPHAIKSLTGHTYVLSNGGGDVTVQYKGVDLS